MLADDRLLSDDGSAHSRASTTHGLREGVNDYISTVHEGSKEGWSGDGSVDDQGDLVLVGHLGDGLHVEARLLGVGGHLGVEEARVVIREVFPLLRLPRPRHPPDLGPPLLHPEVEELKCSTIHPGTGDEVDGLVRVAGPSYEGLNGLFDSRHARGGT